MPVCRRVLAAALLSAVPHGSWAEKARVEVDEQDFLGLDEDYDVEDSLLEGSNKRSVFEPDADVNQLFKTWDKDNSAFIEMEEALQIPDMTRDQIKTYFAQADTNDDDKVSLSELQQLMEGETEDDEEDEGSSDDEEDEGSSAQEDSLLEVSNKRSEFEPDADVNQLFKTWDKDNSAFIEMEEALQIPDMTRDQIQTYFAQADTNDDDKVSLSELQQLMEGETEDDEEDEGSSDDEEDEGSSAQEDSLLEVSFKERFSSLLRQFDADSAAEELVTDFDADGDGALDLNEARQIPGVSTSEIDGYFTRADRDKDQKVTVEELNQLLNEEELEVGDPGQ